MDCIPLDTTMGRPETETHTHTHNVIHNDRQRELDRSKVNLELVACWLIHIRQILGQILDFIFSQLRVKKE
uniref:Uncharacterized protein n=1 Tax=Myripristis murdjan TaxID=586833 RepID=A0A667WIC6_9TELE